MTAADVPAEVTHAAAEVAKIVAHRQVVTRSRHRPADADIWVRGVDMPAGSSVLRQAVAAGLLVESKRGTHHWWFTTPAKKAEADVESGMSDGERAERCVPHVRDMYNRNRAQYGDDTTWWAVDPQLNAIPQDGIRPAIEAGLLIERRVHGLGARLVPAEYVDAYDEASAAHERIAAAYRERHNAAAAELARHAGPAGGRGEHHISLGTTQIERLLALINERPQ